MTGYDVPAEGRFEVTWSSSFWLGNYEALAPIIIDRANGLTLLDGSRTSWDGQFQAVGAEGFRLRLSSIHNQITLGIAADGAAGTYRFDGEVDDRPLASLQDEVEKRLDRAPRPQPAAASRRDRRYKLAGALLLLGAALALLIATT